MQICTKDVLVINKVKNGSQGHSKLFPSKSQYTILEIFKCLQRCAAFQSELRHRLGTLLGPMNKIEYHDISLVCSYNALRACTLINAVIKQALGALSSSFYSVCKFKTTFSESTEKCFWDNMYIIWNQCHQVKCTIMLLAEKRPYFSWHPNNWMQLPSYFSLFRD